MLGRSSWDGPHEGPLRSGGSLFTHRQPLCGSAAGGGPALQPTRSHSGIHWWSLLSLSLSASESQKQLQPQHLCLSPLWSEPLSSGEMTEIASIFKSPFEQAREQNAAARQQLGIYHRRAGSTPSLTLLLALTLLARFHLFHSTWFFISGGVRHF